MSGLEPLAALSLACNMMQIIDSAGKAVKLCKDVYAGSGPDKELLVAQ